MDTHKRNMEIAESRAWQLDAVRFTGTAAESRAWSGTYILTSMDTTTWYGVELTYDYERAAETVRRPMPTTLARH